MECPYCGSIELKVVSNFAHKCMSCGEIVYNEELFDDEYEDDME